MKNVLDTDKVKDESLKFVFTSYLISDSTKNVIVVSVFTVIKLKHGEARSRFRWEK